MTNQHEPDGDTEFDALPPADPVELLERWQQFGASWRVVSRTAEAATVSMCRCDGGEEVQRLTSTDPRLLAWLAGRTSSD